MRQMQSRNLLIHSPLFYVLSIGWFPYVGKIPDGRGFYFLPTVPDFADISDSRRKSVPDSPYIEFMYDRGTGLGDW